VQQVRDQALYNEQTNPQISNQTKIALGLLPQSYGTEVTEHHSYGQHIAYHAHHEVLQTWHQQMHQRSHSRHHHPIESSNSEMLRAPLMITPDSNTMQYLLGQNSFHTNTFDYARISSRYQQQERGESSSYSQNPYTHSSRRHNSHQHYSEANHYTSSDLSTTTTHSWNSYQRHTESSFATSQESLQHTIAMLAVKNADKIRTTGNCAIGPRLTFKELGLDLPQVIATKQGSILEGSGLFKVVLREDVQPGDYGYRHWSESVKRSHGGIDKGDAFIVANVGRNGKLMGANDHYFVVPEDGGRYRNTTFLRPTAAFYARYASVVQHKSSSDA
jgi:hypothetical protein